jgi:hypothetical protein
MSDIAAETAAPRSPWGLWATLGWVILAFVLSAIAGFAVVLIWRPDAITGGTDMLKDGTLISITTIASAVVQVGTLALAARLASWPAGEYLGLVRPATRPALIAIAILMYFARLRWLTYLLGRGIVTRSRLTPHRSARDGGTLPLLWLTFVIAAPVTRRSSSAASCSAAGDLRRSAIPGILVITALFAVIHAIRLVRHPAGVRHRACSAGHAGAAARPCSPS